MRIIIRPGVWTRLPGTAIQLLWEGTGEAEFYFDGHFWQLGPLVRTGSSHLVWLRHDRMACPWPLVPLPVTGPRPSGPSTTRFPSPSPGITQRYPPILDPPPSTSRERRSSIRSLNERKS